MVDADPPQAGKFGDPPDDIDEGSLLFDPTGPPDEDDDDFLPPEPEPSRAPILWMAVVVVVLVGVFSVQLLNGPEDVETPPEQMPVVAPLPVDTTSRAVIMPIPNDTVEGPINSSARLGVRVVGRNGRPLADTALTFTVESGDAILRNEEARTTNEGIAVNFLDLPERPGATTVLVTLPGFEIPPTRIVAITHPAPPARIVMSGGNGQEAEMGRLLPDRASVTIYDSVGNPVPGAIVTFRVTSGNGVRAPGQTETDSLGRAGALWRLGMVEGEQTLVASTSRLGREITFTANATPSASLEIDNPAPSETSPVTVVRDAFAIGGSHVCSLAQGTLACRGTNERGQASPSGALGFVAVVAGASHSCALSSTGVASCWGANDEGQLGDGSRNDRSSPVRVRTDLRFSTLAAGEAHTCGLAGRGVPLCWGENLSGQLGDGTRNNQTVPRIVGGGLGFREITAGWSHTCGLTASGNTFCWGLNSQGQLGDGSNLDHLQPTLVLRSVQRLVAGSEHTCGISAGEVLCWGGNGSGQLGDGSTDARREPNPVSGLPGRATELAAGAVHTCALLSDGQAFCWGQNRQGQLGDGTTESRVTPVPVSGGLRFTEIEAGGAQTCGLTRDGIRYCWGLNLSGQLGDGTRTSRSTPTRVSG